MTDLTFKIFFIVFTIYTLIYTVSYGIHEIKNEQNKYGGTAVILCSLFSIIFGNIVIWIR